MINPAPAGPAAVAECVGSSVAGVVVTVEPVMLHLGRLTLRLV